jgi:hypothetical protein
MSWLAPFATRIAINSKMPDRGFVSIPRQATAMPRNVSKIRIFRLILASSFPLILVCGTCPACLEVPMSSPNVNSWVRIIIAIPELELPPGSVGRVCSTWFDPNTLFEVELPPDDQGFRPRVLLLPDQLQPEESPPAQWF